MTAGTAVAGVVAGDEAEERSWWSSGGSSEPVRLEELYLQPWLPFYVNVFTDFPLYIHNLSLQN